MDQTADTRKRRLHSAHPFWAATPNISVPHEATARHRDHAVIVVGTGISGALMAERLTRRFRRVLVVDRRPPVRGSTLASTAMIQHEIDVPLFALARLIGCEQAERAWRRSVAAVEDLAALAQRLGIDCAMARKRTLYLAGDDHGARALQGEAEMRNAAGIEAEWLNAPTLRRRFGLDRTGAIVSDASASANPAQLTAGLLRVAVGRGAQVISPVELTDFAETGDKVALATADGRLLTADHVVFCTGYEFLPAMASGAHRIMSTWALASETDMARPDWLDDFLVWEASDPYLYFRTAQNGRIIAGGEDEDGAEGNLDDSRTAIKAARIAAKLRRLTGIEIGRPAYAWSAPFGGTTTGLPIIDRVPGCRRSHAVMGFGGNGITFSSIAAQMVAARIEGDKVADDDLFRFPG